MEKKILHVAFLEQKRKKETFQSEEGNFPFRAEEKKNFRQRFFGERKFSPTHPPRPFVCSSHPATFNINSFPHHSVNRHRLPSPIVARRIILVCLMRRGAGGEVDGGGEGDNEE